MLAGNRAIYERFTKTLLQSCKNVWYDWFSIFKKKVHLNGINHIFLSNLPYIQWVISIENSCHLHCHTKYIWSNVNCYNVAATFLSNEHTVIIEQSARDLKTLLQRCKNVRYYSLGILQKGIEYLTYLFIICLI